MRRLSFSFFFALALTCVAFSQQDIPSIIPANTTYTVSTPDRTVSVLCDCDGTIYVTGTLTISGTLILSSTGEIQFGNNGVIVVTPTGQIIMNGGVIDSRGAINTKIETNSTHCLQGTGTFYEVYLYSNSDFNVESTDNFSFRDGGRLYFGNEMYIGGTLNFYGPEGIYTFDQQPSLIVLYDNGYMGLTDGVTLINTPTIQTWNTTTTLTATTSTTRNVVQMRSQHYIHINGIMNFRGTDITNYSSPWYGIRIVNPSAYLFLFNCNIDGSSVSFPAVHLYTANNASNRIESCHISGYGGGHGVKLQTDAAVTNGYSRVTLYCTEIDNFENGVVVDGTILQSGGQYPSTATIDKCRIHDNTVGLWASYGGSAKPSRTCFTDNLNNAIIAYNGGTVTQMWSCYFDNPNTDTLGQIYATGRLTSTIASTINTFVNGQYREIAFATSTNVKVKIENDATAILRNSWWGVAPPVPTSYFRNWTSLSTNLDVTSPKTIPAVNSSICSCSPLPKIQAAHDIVNPAIVDINNYPNPFNPSTTIVYSIAEDVPVSLRVYSSAGELIEILVDDVQTAGSHSVSFNAKGALSSGTYFYELLTPIGSRRGKMILQK